ncbi:MAG: DUF4349 domain-containing protein, partial [Actinomycetota bacterium]|nr:DUF4349 domain-containing protein [Actinomycetota bacterium]
SLTILISGMVFTGCKAQAAPAADKGYNLSSRDEEMAIAEESESMAGEGEVSEDNVANNAIGDIPVTGDRKVIKTAYIEIEIEAGKFDEILSRLTNLAEQNGGFISNSQSYSDSEGNMTSGNITIRIPSNKYISALEKVKEMGTVKSTSGSGQDVTQEYTDLESRLRNYKVQEEVLLDLMAQSKKVTDTLEVQRELSIVQEQIEIIKGRMQYLDDLISFSTIDVYFHEPEPITATGWGFVESLKNGLRGAVKVLNWLAAAILFTSPLWILAGIILLIVWRVIKARNKRRARKEQK